ncbi:hypothetical protein [Actinokineospora iranica]|uniref:Helix-turn-helix domain-containing protein n=1 Tax=Actinokineospora iranica TaxID=1271860 RepID=A0A1G6U8P9_9PSEU|nr:hypothetical protein [Actinokineospora iranica]SDD36925.1 hypothetical protein SAMN05216174_110131 [Actinokineospora iranica]
MSDERVAALRALRGELSLAAFLDRLVEHGLPANRVSRQRLSRLEKGETQLPVTLWEEIAEALTAAGAPLERVAVLRGPVARIDPVPPSTPELRRRQWTRVVSRLAGNKWWHAPLLLVARHIGVRHAAHYQQLFDRYGGQQETMLQQLQARLALGNSSARFAPVPGDAAAIDRAASTVSVRVEHGELFVLTARLVNTGTVPWRDRVLLRLGAPNTSSLPLTPTVLPLPDTDPGGHCDVPVPGRAQWFTNMAEVTYVMVFADLSSCLPGRIVFQVDTRTGELDRSFDLPPGFPAADAP